MASVPAATTHGFLFADLRDYTRFVETRGDQAAVELLTAYRSVVREVVDRFGGAEIRTEGDSFYIVFPSAATAVEGGRAILQAATAATERDPAHPMSVGVGVHAGEIADTVEGYVGSAVNIAARVCARAAPGELLVTDTVRSLTRSRLAVGFLPRGTPRLKGIEEPIALFAVSPSREMAGTGVLRAPVPAPAWARPSVPRAAAAIVLVAVLAIGGGLAASSVLGPSTTQRPTIVAEVSPTLPASSPTPAPSSTAFPTAAETKLLATLPADLRATCVRGSGDSDLVAAGFNGTVVGEQQAAPAPGATPKNILFPVLPVWQSQASIACRPVGGPSAAWFLWYDLRGGTNPQAPAEVAVVSMGGRYSVPDRDCSNAPGHGAWRSAAGASGDVTCLKDSGPGGQPWLYWSFGSAHVLGIATAPVGHYATLYAWWQSVTPFLR